MAECNSCHGWFCDLSSTWASCRVSLNVFLSCVEVEESLDLKILTRWLDEMKETTVSVHVPRFRVEDSFSLKEKLQAMGLTDLFSSEKASLPGEGAGSRLCDQAVRWWLRGFIRLPRDFFERRLKSLPNKVTEMLQDQFVFLSIKNKTERFIMFHCLTAWTWRTFQPETQIISGQYLVLEGNSQLLDCNNTFNNDAMCITIHVWRYNTKTIWMHLEWYDSIQWLELWTTHQHNNVHQLNTRHRF